MSSTTPGPNATLIGHGAVGFTGGRILHAIAKPKTALGAFFVWLLGAAAMIRVHAKFDLPVARLVAAVAPAIG